VEKKISERQMIFTSAGQSNIYQEGEESDLSAAMQRLGVKGHCTASTWRASDAANFSM